MYERAYGSIKKYIKIDCKGSAAACACVVRKQYPQRDFCSLSCGGPKGGRVTYESTAERSWVRFCERPRPTKYMAETVDCSWASAPGNAKCIAIIRKVFDDAVSQKELRYLHRGADVR